MLCAMMPFAMAQDGGQAEIKIRKPPTGYYPLDLSKIDIAAEDPAGRTFCYRIHIGLNTDQFNQYVAPLADVTNVYQGKWKAGQAQNFTVTFPLSLLDENLEYNSDDISTSSTGFLKLKSKSPDQVVLEGKQGVNNVCTNYAKSSYIYINIPVTLPAGNYQAAAEKGGITLRGTVTVTGGLPGTDPLTFDVDHTIPVIDSNNLRPALTVTGGSTPEFVKDEWVLTDGEYTISGTAMDYEGLKIAGEVTLNLDSANIQRVTTDKNLYGPAIDIESGSVVRLNLLGDSTVQGSLGNAGVHVSKDASLTIFGTGCLTAIGGDAYEDEFAPDLFNYRTGGAGIGGNGLFEFGDGDDIYEEPNFGQIYITAGTVKATGGATTIGNRGAGAGIGTGGASSMWRLDPAFEGSIVISEDADVTATGGDSDDWHTYYTGGGAGIGTGGVTGNIWKPYHNKTSITIKGGTVVARGEADGAGIGSGANVKCNTVSITGGDITAIGGDEDDGSQYGGAGIGGGDNGGVVSIVISGDADVTATGGGASAGIGSGENEYRDEENGACALVEISGSAKVVATGGAETYYSRNRGGAGIGSGLNGIADQINILEQAQVTAIGGKGAAGIGGGFDGNVTGGVTIKGATVKASGSRYDDSSNAEYDGLGGAGIGSGVTVAHKQLKYDNGCGEISITDKATVQAYTEGRDTNAIGVGGGYSGKEANALRLDDTISLWAQTPDNSWPALLNAASDPISYQSQRVYLAANNPDSGKADAWLTRPAAQPKDAFDYELGTDLKIDGNAVPMAAPKAPVGNWATLYGLPSVTATYQFVGEVPDGAVLPDPDVLTPGAVLSLRKPADVAGWLFDGWYTNPACTDKFADGAALTADATLYGKWILQSTPVVPTKAAYRVEHYRKQPDGSYKLTDIDFPLYGEIGKTVSIVPKVYEGYLLNRAESVLSGVVVMPSGDACLVLTALYDPISQPNAAPSTPPRTGDTGHPLLWLSLLAASALGMGACLMLSRKRRSF